MELVRATVSPLKGWRPWHRGAGRPAEPGAALFRALRLRLTLWYSGVILLAFFAFGMVLYFGLQDLTLGPVHASLQSVADFAIQEWQRIPPHRCGEPGGRPFPSPRPPAPLPYYLACFDTHGQIIGVLPSGSGTVGGGVPDAFLDESLVQDALRSGAATDIVDGGEEVGPIYRLAVLVPNPLTGARQGVVQVGQSIAPQWDTLRLLR